MDTSVYLNLFLDSKKIPGDVTGEARFSKENSHNQLENKRILYAFENIQKLTKLSNI